MIHAIGVWPDGSIPVNEKQNKAGKAQNPKVEVTG
jgi:hypothetical protein